MNTSSHRCEKCHTIIPQSRSRCRRHERVDVPARPAFEGLTIDLAYNYDKAQIAAFGAQRETKA